MGRYGLRVFHKLISYEDAYLRKTPIVGYFDNFTGYKCKRNGAIYEDVGHLISRNFKVADNVLAGIEYSLMNFPLLSTESGHIQNALVIGKTDNWVKNDIA